ncbi:hypothetical protein HDV04_001152 [Boothiomyces sp. JEL0838]|nr:hypothetical protein HDV04_001152 [Boothiomyces sp. JEL0838]
MTTEKDAIFLKQVFDYASNGKPYLTPQDYIIACVCLNGFPPLPCEVPDRDLYFQDFKQDFIPLNRQIFLHFDSKSHGYLDQQDLVNAQQKYKPNMNSRHIQRAYSTLVGNDRINFSAFKSLLD